MLRDKKDIAVLARAASNGRNDALILQLRASLKGTIIAPASD
jgi:hypothetical protein